MKRCATSSVTRRNWPTTVNTWSAGGDRNAPTVVSTSCSTNYSATARPSWPTLSAVVDISQRASTPLTSIERSEESRVGNECRYRMEPMLALYYRIELSDTDYV